jgi:hypothetical protein
MKLRDLGYRGEISWNGSQLLFLGCHFSFPVEIPAKLSATFINCFFQGTIRVTDI